MVVIEENHAFGSIIGNTAEAPYINNTLMAGGALLTNYFAITHPSEPNYLALYAGSTFGVTDDNFHAEPDPSLATVLQTGGKSFVGYVDSGSPEKHNPWEAFPEGTSVEQDFGSSFPTTTAGYASLPTISWVIPNLNNDMHDGSIGQGDSWLQTHLNGYAQWAKTNNSLLIVTWDEDEDTGGNNQIPAIFYGANVKQGSFNTNYNHYNMLATLCRLAGQAGRAPRNAANAAVITEVFGPAPLPADVPAAPTSFAVPSA